MCFIWALSNRLTLLQLSHLRRQDRRSSKLQGSSFSTDYYGGSGIAYATPFYANLSIRRGTAIRTRMRDEKKRADNAPKSPPYIDTPVLIPTQLTRHPAASLARNTYAAHTSSPRVAHTQYIRNSHVIHRISRDSTSSVFANGSPLQQQLF